MVGLVHHVVMVMEVTVDVEDVVVIQNMDIHLLILWVVVGVVDDMVCMVNHNLEHCYMSTLSYTC